MRYLRGTSAGIASTNFVLKMNWLISGYWYRLFYQGAFEVSLTFIISIFRGTLILVITLKGSSSPTSPLALLTFKFGLGFSHDKSKIYPIQNFYSPSSYTCVSQAEFNISTFN
jgi:hypothetical protein